MSEPEEPKEFKTTPEEARDNRRQVWLTLLVMLTSSCVGILALTVILWFLFKKVLQPGGF
jgi:flagellar biogenesis protein FliO